MCFRGKNFISFAIVLYCICMLAARLIDCLNNIKLPLCSFIT